VLLAAAAAYYWFYLRGFETTDDAFVDGDIVRISPQIEGQLVAVPAASNSQGEAGDVLARIEPSGPEAELALRQAQLAEAQASLAEARANVGQAEARVSEQQAALHGLRVRAENARRQADRLQDLQQRSGSAAVSRQAVDDALAEARQAEADAAAGEARLASARSQVAAAQAAVQSAQARIQAAQAQVRNAEVTVSDLTITAPIGGQLVQKSVNVGSYVEPGTPIMVIVPRDLYVTANFKETQLDDIRVGQKVDLSVDAFPDVDFRGTVQSIQQAAGQVFQLLPPQNATGNYVKVVQRVPVRISIDSPSPHDYPIGPGMSVVPSVHVD